MRKIAVLTTLFIGIVSCKSKENVAEIEEFPVVKPIELDTNTHQDYVAEIQAVKNIEIRAKAQGFLEKVNVDEGSFVKEGQLLFSINSAEYKEKLSKASALRKISETEQQSADLELQNTKNLLDKNIVSKIEYEFAKNKLAAAKAKVEEAKAEESNAKLLLSYCEIRAPFSGYINRLPIKIGSLIEEGTLLTTLSQNNQVYAYFDISEREYYSYLKSKNRDALSQQAVSLILADGKEYSLKGRIETMDAEIDERTGNLALRATFDNPEKILKHGASGRVRLSKSLENAIIIPQKSTFEIQDRIYVYVVNKKTKRVSTRPIKVESRLSHFYVISEGVTPDDYIIYEGVQLAKEGMEIKMKEMKMKQIIRSLKQL